MTDITDNLKEIEITVRAGPGGEDSDVFHYTTSPLPPWVRTVNDPLYRRIANAAVEAAAEAVRATGRTLTLTYTIDLR